MYCAKNLKKLLLSILLLTVAVNSYGQYNAVSFYVVAHQDQWQLFMGINAYNDMLSGGAKDTPKKVVMIYTTAGDESCNGAPLNVPYYLARHEGADHCVEFCADQWGSHETWTLSKDTISGHPILRTQYKNVVSYCLRLPGGCYDGGLNGQCLAWLHNGTIPAMDAVDSSANYSGWDDLANTIRSIVVKESSGINEIWLNTADTDRVINPGDHPDNIHTAHLGIAAVADMPHVSLHLFREYSIAHLPVNLSNRDIANKAALLSLLDYGRTEHGQPSEWSPDKINFISRNYYRTIIK